MPDEPVIPITPEIPPPPPIAAETKSLAAPVMIRQITDTVQPTVVKEAADIEERVRQYAGQRMVSNIWEIVQAIIALSVVWTGTGVCAVLAMRTNSVNSEDDSVKEAAIGALLFLTGVGNLVIGFYFGRTNHEKTGGIGGNRERDHR